MKTTFRLFPKDRHIFREDPAGEPEESQKRGDDAMIPWANRTTRPLGCSLSEEFLPDIVPSSVLWDRYFKPEIFRLKKILTKYIWCTDDMLQYLSTRTYYYYVLPYVELATRVWQTRERNPIQISSSSRPRTNIWSLVSTAVLKCIMFIYCTPPTLSNKWNSVSRAMQF